jgi:alcohol dehydrogenase YqhD (iron-dependent ADH family)
MGGLELNVKKMKKTIELSKLNPKWEIDEVVNYLLDNGCDSVVDDTMEQIAAVYLYEEMYDVWDNLKRLING